jgi:hypothetical protein
MFEINYICKISLIFLNIQEIIIKDADHVFFESHITLVLLYTYIHK